MSSNCETNNIRKSLFYNFREKVFTKAKLYECTHCNKKFVTPSSLKTHTDTHANGKPYKCKICSKAFKKHSNLNQHSIVHTDEKPFQCNVCKKKLTWKSSLRSHYRIHSNTKPFSCTLCKKDFSQSGNLRYHVTTHFSEIDLECENNQKLYDLKKCLVDCAPRKSILKNSKAQINQENAVAREKNKENHVNEKNGENKEKCNDIRNYENKEKCDNKKNGENKENCETEENSENNKEKETSNDNTQNNLAQNNNQDKSEAQVIINLESDSEDLLIIEEIAKSPKENNISVKYEEITIDDDSDFLLNPVCKIDLDSSTSPDIIIDEQEIKVEKKNVSLDIKENLNISNTLQTEISQLSSALLDKVLDNVKKGVRDFLSSSS